MVPINFGFIKDDNLDPSNTANNEDVMRASDDAKKIFQGLTFLAEENNMVAIWVLSPSSVRKIDR